MGIRAYKPVTNGRRQYTVSDFSDHDGHAAPPLVEIGPAAVAQRLRTHHVALPRRAKRRFRVIDFRRDKIGVPARRDDRIRSQPHRAVSSTTDGEKRHILAPDGLKVGDSIGPSKSADIRPGNCLQLQHIPVGTMIHGIEMKKGRGGQLVRSAGVAAQLMAKDGSYATVKLPSGEIRKVHIECRATVGQVSNQEHQNIKVGKAGRTRWLGRRPHNRGVTMNPVDHPMGGGGDRTSGGRHPCSPWGQLSRSPRPNNKRTD
jgi:large subunit ribosomal protein L2